MDSQTLQVVVFLLCLGNFIVWPVALIVAVVLTKRTIQQADPAMAVQAAMERVAHHEQLLIDEMNSAALQTATLLADANQTAKWLAETAIRTAATGNIPVSAPPKPKPKPEPVAADPNALIGADGNGHVRPSMILNGGGN